MRLQLFAAVGLALLVSAPPVLAEGTLVLDANMWVLHAKLPTATNRFVQSNQPGQVFLPGEAVDITLLLSKEADQGTKNFGIEIQEITTRDPERKVEGSQGYSDTAGSAPVIALEGQPRVHPFQAAFTDKPQATVEVKNLPLPERFGTYALVLVRGGARQFLTTLCRVPKPRDNGTILTTPIFGEGVFIDRAERYEQRAKTYARMGVRGWRSELGWSANDKGETDWSRYDALFSAAEKAGCKIMVTLGAGSDWTRPFKVPTPAVGWTPQTGGYSATGDWVGRSETLRALRPLDYRVLPALLERGQRRPVGNREIKRAVGRGRHQRLGTRHGPISGSS